MDHLTPHLALFEVYMATFAEVEDLRDWFVDVVAEFLVKIDELNGDEPAATLEQIQAQVEKMHQEGRVLIMYLNELLILKKREEG